METRDPLVEHGVEQACLHPALARLGRGGDEPRARSGAVRQPPVERLLGGVPGVREVAHVEHATRAAAGGLAECAREAIAERDRIIGRFAIRQVREALGDDADQPQYVKTVPKRGYRFIAPVSPLPAAHRSLTDVSLQKALWTNIAELRLAEARRRRLSIAVAVLVGVLIVMLAIRR